MPTPKKKAKKTFAPHVPTIRQAKRKFRFDKDRDDLKPLSTKHSDWVFTTASPIDTQDGTPVEVGVYGCPVVVLDGYKRVTTAPGCQSIRAAEGPDAFVLGRLVELSHAEISRLDEVAEDIRYHRIRVEVRGAMTGHVFFAWVYQCIAHASAADLQTVAVLPSASNQLKIAA